MSSAQSQRNRLSPPLIMTLMLAVASMFSGILAPTALAQDPLRLTPYITDEVNALNSEQRDRVQNAIDALYAKQKVRLWVVYVADFGGLSASAWSDRTRVKSDFGTQDAVLAVATVDRSYYLDIPEDLNGINSSALASIRENTVEPQLRKQDWAEAAIVTAQSLEKEATLPSRDFGVFGLTVIGLVILAIAIAIGWSLYRSRLRKKAELSQAASVDPTNPQALAHIPLHALDTRSKEVLIEVDNAIRTSEAELALARDEFDEATTTPFTSALTEAKTALASAFTIRQRLDDAIPESAQEQQELLTELIVLASKADSSLEAKVAEFDAMRNLLINAPDRLNTLTQNLIALTVRIPASEKILDTLHQDFDPTSLTSVSANVNMARQRINFAEKNIAQGRIFTEKPVGQQGAVVALIRGAEAAIDQAQSLLDAVDNAATNIALAVQKLPEAIADVHNGITRAQTLSIVGGADLNKAKATALSALADAQTMQATDPLGAFNKIIEADSALDLLLDKAEHTKAEQDRAQQVFTSEIASARGQLLAATDFIATRRGAIGAQPRTQIAEAGRYLETAESLRTTNITEAIEHTRKAAKLATGALTQAQLEVQKWEEHRSPQSFSANAGSHIGAELGGIIIGGLLRGALGGGFDGGPSGSPASYGGSSSSGRLGGGGRF
ncbi:MAG: TPM domain-containing protein [Mycobacteriaceae bacterium]